MEFPYYLKNKLNTIDISSIDQLKHKGYLTVFAELRANFPSLAYQALFDLYLLELGLTRESNCLSSEQKKILIDNFKALPPIYPSLDEKKIRSYLDLAESQAQLALSCGEVPIGAVITHKGKIIAAGYNQTRIKNDILCHAEIVAIREAQKHLNNYRLDNCDLFVTIEPCLMCSGAIINSRIKRVFFGANEPKTGACLSQFNVFANKNINSHCQVIGPIDNGHYSRLLQSFFREKKIRLLNQGVNKKTPP